jgi:hypothetical protein
VATQFRDAIRLYADPFSYRLLFSLLRGETPVLLDLDDRPAAYDDVGRATRWGSALPELENFAALMNDSGEPSSEPRRRSDDLDVALAPPWSGEPLDRRASPGRTTRERRTGERRTRIPGPSPRLTRSCYEKVFLNLGHCRRLRIDGELLTPAKVKGWYHAVFCTPEGEERVLSIDQLLAYSGAWV